MNILVTGGSGFLGSYVVAALAEAGHYAVAYDVTSPGAEAMSVLRRTTKSWKYTVGQIGDSARLFDVCRNENIDAVVHNGALVGLETSLVQPTTTYLTNVMGSINIYELARQAQLAKVIYISSNAVYHKSSSDSLRETDPVFSISNGNPAGHYGASKVAAEVAGLTYATFHGIDFVSLRVTAVYGFGMHQPMYIKPMVESAVRGEPIQFDTGGPMRRDYTYVIDCADAICRAMASNTIQRVFNISSGVTYTAANVAEVVQRVIPGAQIVIGDELNPIESENVKMRAPLNLDAAAEQLDWRPQWSLESGILDYADRYRHFLNKS